MPRDLVQGSSQPKPSHRSTECELDHLLSSQNRCKLGTLLALESQHPAIKQIGKGKIKISKCDSNSPTVTQGRPQAKFQTWAWPLNINSFKSFQHVWLWSALHIAHSCQPADHAQGSSLISQTREKKSPQTNCYFYSNVKVKALPVPLRMVYTSPVAVELFCSSLLLFLVLALLTIPRIQHMRPPYLWKQTRYHIINALNGLNKNSIFHFVKWVFLFVY